MNENSNFIGNDYMKIKVIRIFAHNLLVQLINRYKIKKYLRILLYCIFTFTKFIDG